MVLGVRGLPDVEGGVETHAMHLYPRLAELGCQVEVLVRTPFAPPDRRSFGTIRLRRIWAPTSPGLEALVHSLLGVIYAGLARPDILHIHAVGPALVTPIARLFGLRVVVTHHGPDYDREKWGRVARCVLRYGERFGMNYSHARIAISQVIVELIRDKYGRESELIPNGVTLNELATSTAHIARFGLTPGRYFLQVGRMVPEKRQLELIKAYQATTPSDWKLALVGGIGTDAYSKEVETAAESAGVVLTGFLKGAALEQIYTHAGGFVLPSSHEGLPIALLEALSYGLPAMASDIPANLAVGLEPASYFPVGNLTEMASGLRRISQLPRDEQARADRRGWVAARYDWGRIAEQTHALYSRVAKV
jgi:glycosyltransferase involved in cell wall biosynthesis